VNVEPHEDSTGRHEQALAVYDFSAFSGAGA
jgi:hypothetical protein